MIHTSVKSGEKVIPVEFMQAVNPPKGRAKALKPEGMVIHYSAGGEYTESWFQNKTNKNSSAHFVISRDGSLVQQVDTEIQAWHAGRSSWRGKKSCNKFLLGVEIENWGLLKKWHGKLRTWPKKWTAPYAGPKAVLINGQYWEPYTQEALDTLAVLAVSMMGTFEFLSTEFPGHSEVSPKRKIDPGPAFPRAEFLTAIQPPTVVKHNPELFDSVEDTKVIKEEKTKRPSGKSPSWLTCDLF